MKSDTSNTSDAGNTSSLSGIQFLSYVIFSDFLNTKQQKKMIFGILFICQFALTQLEKVIIFRDRQNLPIILSKS